MRTPLLLATVACAPVLTHGRYQVGAAKVADLPGVHAEWDGPGREKVNFEAGYAVWITRPSPECPEIGLSLRHGHHPDTRWTDDGLLVIEGGGQRHVLDKPEFRLSRHWDEVGAKVSKPALQALVDGGHIRVGASRYELDQSVRDAIAALLAGHRCELAPETTPEATP